MTIEPIGRYAWKALTDEPPIDPSVIRFKAGRRREGAACIEYVTIHGYRRAFVKLGKGPALLLIHGIGDSSDTWRTVMEELAKDHTVIAPDLLGHGRSEKPRADYSVAAYANGMRDLLSVLEIDRVTVVGHSLGGGVAAQFAYQFPQLCERLVLVGSGGVGRSVSPLLRLAAIPGVEALMPLFGLPPVKAFSRLAADVLRQFNTAIGRDAEEVLAVFDALPDTNARRAILRTLRSGGRLARPGDHHARPGLPGRGHADAADLGPSRCRDPIGSRSFGSRRHAGQRVRDLR